MQKLVRFALPMLVQRDSAIAPLSAQGKAGRSITALLGAISQPNTLKYIKNPAVPMSGGCGLRRC